MALTHMQEIRKVKREIDAVIARNAQEKLDAPMVALRKKLDKERDERLVNKILNERRLKRSASNAQTQSPVKNTDVDIMVENIFQLSGGHNGKESVPESSNHRTNVQTDVDDDVLAEELFRAGGGA